MQYQLMGGICHGLGCFAFFFDGGCGLAKNNVVCAAILFMVNTWIEVGRPLPETLAVLLDNAGSDNKNHCTFGFLASLVETGVFKSVLVSADS